MRHGVKEITLVGPVVRQSDLMTESLCSIKVTYVYDSPSHFSKPLMFSVYFTTLECVNGRT